MLGRLDRIFHPSRSRAGVDLIEEVEVVADSGGLLQVRPLTSSLTADYLQDVVKELQQAGLRTYVWVHFDFSRVRELAGPWGAHFAMLLRLGEQSGRRVSLGGLRRQPAALAWLFRNSPEVRALLSGHRTARQGTAQEALLQGSA